MFDIFGNLFDINDEGSRDLAQRAAELGFVDEIIDDDEFDDNDDEYDEYDDGEDDDDEW